MGREAGRGAETRPPEQRRGLRTLFFGLIVSDSAVTMSCGTWGSTGFDMHSGSVGAEMEEDTYFFHLQLWFQTSDRQFQRFESDFWCFCEVFTGKIHCGRNKIDHGCPCGMEFTLVSLYSTEITHYRLWLVEYKLTQVNSVPHGHPLWNLYVHTAEKCWHETQPWECCLRQCQWLSARMQ